MRPPMPRLAAVAVSGWSDSSGASPLPWWGERPRVGVAMRALRLLNDDGFHQCPEVLVDRLFLGLSDSGRLHISIAVAAMFWPARANYGGLFPLSMMLRWTWRA